eukprot:5253071-Amphidinium_carterae.1
MKVTTKGTGKQDIGAGTATGLPSGSQQMGRDTSVGQIQHGAVLHPKVASVQKIFACQNRFVMLLKCSGCEDASTSEFWLIRGSSLTHLQILNSGNAHALRRALDACSGVSASASSYPFKDRVVITDSASTNFAAEKLMKSSLGCGWCHLHQPCIVHLLAMAHQHAFSCLQPHISGIVNFSLSLALGGSMELYRQSVAHVLEHEIPIVVLRGYPTARCQAYQQYILDLCCTQGGQLEVRKQLLQKYLNGDWTNTSQVQVYVVPGLEVNESHLKRIVKDVVSQVLCGRCYSIYSQHRWLGCLYAVQEVTLGLALHGVGAAAFKHFARRCGSKVDSGVSEVMNDHESDYEFPYLLDVDAPHASTIPPHDEDEEEGGAQSGQHASGVSGLTPSEMAKMNAKRRRVTLEWLAQEPFSMLLVFLHCLEPIACLLEQYTGRSGDIHLQKGRSELARLLMTYDDSKGRGAEGVVKTCYQAFVEQVSEKEFYMKLSQLTLFTLVKEGSLSDQLTSIPACLLDNFSAALVGCVRTGHFSSAEAEAIVESLLNALSPDIVDMEWGHSRVARLLRVQGASTHVPNMDYINSQYVCYQHTQRRRAVVGPSVVLRLLASQKPTLKRKTKQSEQVHADKKKQKEEEQEEEQEGHLYHLT